VGRALDAIAPYTNDIEEAIVLGVLSRFGKIDTDQILWDLISLSSTLKGTTFDQ